MIEINGATFPNGNDFRQYLRGKNPRAKAGDCRETGTCPLAEYLLALNPKAVLVAVDDETLRVTFERGHERDPYYLHTGWEIADTPIWAKEFIDSVDSREGETVTIGTCLKLMESLEEYDLSEEPELAV